jgi:hypothetical protein
MNEMGFYTCCIICKSR